MTFKSLVDLLEMIAPSHAYHAKSRNIETCAVQEALKQANVLFKIKFIIKFSISWLQFALIHLFCSTKLLQ